MRITGILIATLLLGWTCLVPAAARERPEILVGGYDFPPFVNTAPDGRVSGLTLDLIDALNHIQHKVVFRFVLTSPRRRYLDLMADRFDAIFFEEPQWGWRSKPYPVDFSTVFLTGGEVFIARSKPGRGQSYFKSLKGKSLVGILGYHYAFAGYDADPAHLAAAFDIKLVSQPASSIVMVLEKRADIAIVTKSYLWSYLAAHPALRGRLLISDRLDQLYRHRILLRRGAPVTIAEIDRLLEKMRRDGILARLWRKAGIVDPGRPRRGR
jgi:ABC-type amino acid transport substrate-binding protein